MVRRGVLLQVSSATTMYLHLQFQRFLWAAEENSTSDCHRFPTHKSPRPPQSTTLPIRAQGKSQSALLWQEQNNIFFLFGLPSPFLRSYFLKILVQNLNTGIGLLANQSLTKTQRALESKGLANTIVCVDCLLLLLLPTPGARCQVSRTAKRVRCFEAKKK